MNNNLDSQLTSLIHTNADKIVFLCGAGISMDYPTSIPTVNTFINSVLSECEVNKDIVHELNNRLNKVNYRFESLVDEIRKKCDKNLDLANIFDSKTYNSIHYFLAKMIQRGSQVITTNFDNCIENAYCSFNCIEAMSRYVYDGFDLNEITKLNESSLIKVHGSHALIDDDKEELVITISALSKTTKAFSMLPNWKNCLLDMFKNKIIVVIGYSCSDDFDLVPLLAESHPNKLIWINYYNGNEFPMLQNRIDNSKVKELAYKINVKYYNGQVNPFLNEWSNSLGLKIQHGNLEKQYKISDYILRNYDSKAKKMILCNEILLAYGLYDKLFRDENNNQIRIQNIKGLYRTGNYEMVLSKCELLLNEYLSKDIRKELLYYYSSVLYYKQKYIEAIRICVEGINISEDDPYYFLNMKINYASISYVYGSTLDDNEKHIWINNAIDVYKEVLEKSIGINIEAEANALWGLGNISKYYGDNNNALFYLKQAKTILEQIGNAYAIDLISETINSIE